MNTENRRVTLAEALELTMSDPEVNRGVLYLPEEPWTLDTVGMFFDFDKDMDPDIDQIPEEIKVNGWKETLDTDLIDQVIFNARSQQPNVTIDELCAAFTYYFRNDAFLKFKWQLLLI